MHEMSIAEGILDIALDYAKQNDAKVVHEVGLILGEMAGVEMESLDFSWRLITKDTIAEGAKLTVRHTPLIGRCSKCGKEFHPNARTASSRPFRGASSKSNIWRWTDPHGNQGHQEHPGRERPLCGREYGPFQRQERLRRQLHGLAGCGQDIRARAHDGKARRRAPHGRHRGRPLHEQGRRPH